MNSNSTLKFSQGNEKMHHLASLLRIPKSNVVSFDLPAGWTCPGADICYARADKESGKITKGKRMQFLCYASHGESYRRSVRLARWHNLDLLKASTDENTMTDLILASIPRNVKVVRIHSSGDFYNQKYLHAWINVARKRPDIIFFGYTKVLPFLYQIRDANLPNLKFVYSIGGVYDSKRDESIPACHVAMDEESALYPIVCRNNEADDYYKIVAQESFSIIVH